MNKDKGEIKMSNRLTQSTEASKTKARKAHSPSATRPSLVVTNGTLKIENSN